jgi:hypothetical protein
VGNLVFERRMQQMAGARGYRVKRHLKTPDRYVLIHPQTGAIIAGKGDGLTDEELTGILARTRSSKKKNPREVLAAQRG